MRTLLRAIVVFAISCVLSKSFALAKSSSQRDALLERSAASGVGIAEVTVLRTKRSSTGAANATLQSLGAAGALPASAYWANAQRQTGHGVAFDSGRWHLLLSDDGRAGKLNHDEGVSDCAELGEKRSDVEMASIGEAFVLEKLQSVVQLAVGEQIVFNGAKHQYRRSASLDGRVNRLEYCGSTVEFGRRVAGLAIVGPGSKVRIDLDFRGSVTGFVFDWPQYVETGVKQAVLNLGDINARAPQSEISASGNWSVVARMECGLFDPGYKRRIAGGPIQSACVYHMRHRKVDSTGQNTESASIHVVPAGVTLIKDPSWRYLQALCTHGAVCLDQ